MLAPPQRVGSDSVPLVRLRSDSERVASNERQGYDYAMSKAQKFELAETAPIVDAEDRETLAAIDEGLRDAEAGRTVSSEELRKLLPTWISGSGTRKKR
jgi:predicted transcriptional regulator